MLFSETIRNDNKQSLFMPLRLSYQGFSGYVNNRNNNIT